MHYANWQSLQVQQPHNWPLLSFHPPARKSPGVALRIPNRCHFSATIMSRRHLLWAQHQALQRESKLIVLYLSLFLSSRCSFLPNFRLNWTSFAHAPKLLVIVHSHDRYSLTPDLLYAGIRSQRTTAKLNWIRHYPKAQSPAVWINLKITECIQL